MTFGHPIVEEYPLDSYQSSSSAPVLECIQCHKQATFMCSACGYRGPRYCSTLCQQEHWRLGHNLECQEIPKDDDLLPTDMERKQAMDPEKAEDLIFYTHQIYRIIKPVVACIVLSIFWVKVGYSEQSDYSPVQATYVSITSTSTIITTPNQTNTTTITSAFANAGIIIAQIIGVTILIVFFFKRGWIKALIGFFMVVVLLLLGFMTYLLILNLIQVFSIPLDFITLVFGLWNFAVVGLLSIFWKGPLWLQQVYLTIMSSLMAFSLTGLEQWTTWILLGLLAVWDLIAVLCPFGPLKLLIESSKKQQREVPALLYSVNAVWFMMASPDHFYTKPSQFNEDQRLEPSVIRLSGHSFISSRRSKDGFTRLDDGPVSSTPAIREEEPAEIRDDEDAERSGLKLGLGDFVFYSVLIARAAMYDWITTICCTIAVLTGLTTTIFLLAIYQKALPALPISIAFGILYYFVAKTVLVPYIGSLCVFGMVGL
ncbi:Presenilin-domain-containing protein [Pilobolus umbonatus]|nr:Presenilin-domain-containing protein [Pilobolus umbonatus]